MAEKKFSGAFMRYSDSFDNLLVIGVSWLNWSARQPREGVSRAGCMRSLGKEDQLFMRRVFNRESFHRKHYLHAK